MRAGHRPVRQSHPVQRRWESRQGDVNSRPLLQRKDAPMTGPAHPRRRGSYGIDAPYAFGAIAVLTVAYLIIAIIIAIDSGRVWLFLPVLFMLTMLAFVFHTTLRGKFLVWAELLDQ